MTKLKTRPLFAQCEYYFFLTSTKLDSLIKAVEKRWRGDRADTRRVAWASRGIPEWNMEAVLKGLSGIIKTWPTRDDLDWDWAAPKLVGG
jgi:hypothetical protein